jgi:RimJ/RimL family protein N-acetyltransferase
VPEQPLLETARLLLRPLRADDATTVQRLAGAAEVADTTLNIPHPYEDGMAEAWIATLGPGWEQGALATFAVTEPAEGLVGVVGLRVEPAQRQAELGYWIGVPYWGRGYATEAAGALIRLGFARLGLDRIYAHHLVRNPASGRVMTKNGMRWEGIRKAHLFRAGRFEDLAVYAITRDEWTLQTP